MRPLDRVLFRSATVQVGAFTCATRDPRFRDSGPTENHIVVFPRNGVWIRHAGSRAFVADPQVATIYNRGQEYTREPISSDGDRCDWFAVAPCVALEIARACDARAGDDPDRPFRHEFVACAAELYWRQRALFHRVERGDIDAFEAEESAIGIVANAVAAAAGVRRAARPSRGVADAHRDLAERARADIVAHVAERSTLSEMASRLGASAFHLCRVFRRQTGSSLHEYRTDLRHRLVLERLAEPRVNLSRLAAEFGFSSHSHLTAALRRRTGSTPSALRRVLLGAAGDA
jgi:AraC family transcriptional regulator